MEQKTFTAQNTGMSRDIAISKSDNTHAYENFNIRVDTRDGEDFYSITNERGQKLIPNAHIEGTVLGYANIDNCLVVFTHSDDYDHIYKIASQDTTIETLTITELTNNQNLNFDNDHPIETLVSVEADDIKKVYWADGKNSVRVINIMKPLPDASDIDLNTIYDFVPQIDGNLTVNITKEHNSSGGFVAGTTQYFITLYRKYGQESHIVYQSPLLYNAFADRGASPDETTDCSYRLNIKVNGAESFDYMRVYSYVKSNEGTGMAYVVGDYAVKSEVVVIDNGSHLTATDPAMLAFLGGDDIIANTITSKGNKLFLGNITITSVKGVEQLAQVIKDTCFEENGWESKDITYSYDTINRDETSGQYPYNIQLDKSQAEITSFKGGEKYRFAVQFIDKKGTRTQAFWVGDKVNGRYPIVDSDHISRVIPIYSLPYDVLTLAQDLGFTKWCLLVAEATESDRSVIAQGIVNPTVFNLYDRTRELNWTRASWICRPQNSVIANGHYELLPDSQSPYAEIQNSYYSKEDTLKHPYYTEDDDPGKLKYYAWSITLRVKSDGTGKYFYATWAEVDNSGNPILTKDNIPFFGSRTLIIDPGALSGFKVSTAYESLVAWWATTPLPKDRLPKHFDEDKTSFPWDNKEHTITGNTYEYSKDSKYIGFLNLSRNKWFVDDSVVTINSPEITDDSAAISASNVRFRIVGVADLDAVTSSYTVTVSKPRFSGDYIRQVSLNKSVPSADITGFLNQSVYKDAVMNLEKGVNGKDLNENDLPIRDTGDDTYYNLYIANKAGALANNVQEDATYGELVNKEIINLRYASTTSYISSLSKAWTPPMGLSYAGISYESGNSLLSIGGNKYYEGTVNTTNICTDNSGTLIRYPLYGNGVVCSYSKDSIPIKFNSTTHAVIALKQAADNIITIPQTLGKYNKESLSKVKFLWENNYSDYTIHSGEPFNVDNKSHKNYLYIGELYREYDLDNDPRYGGTSENAVEQNTFVRCSDDVEIDFTGDSIADARGTRGDTYIQRYDCVKTRPVNDTEIQKYTDIISVMLETHINLDGRYDTKRKATNLLTVDYSQFPYLNKSYTVLDNYFKSSVLDEKYTDSTKSCQIVHSLVKTPGEEVDTWTNTTLSAVVACEGQYGDVNKLLNFNNTIYAFQDKAISAIPYNERTQISNTKGVPIEIANSSTVGDPSYISTSTGCYNKQSIVSTQSGIYFADDINKKLVCYDGKQIQDLGAAKGLSLWARKASKMVKWTPGTPKGYKGFYDNIYGDVYFHTDSGDHLNTICYNEKVGEFTSFFDYGNVDVYDRIWDSSVSIKDNNLYENHTGEYGIIYGEKQDYYSTYRITPDPYGDKVYTIAEYRGDTYDSVARNVILPFNYIEAWNDYQSTGSIEIKLNPINTYPDAQRKFRMWRTDIPRDSKDRFRLNRIRSPWMYLKLSKNADTINKLKMQIHDLTVRYFE